MYALYGAAHKLPSKLLLLILIKIVSAFIFQEVVKLEVHYIFQEISKNSKVP